MYCKKPTTDGGIKVKIGLMKYKIRNMAEGEKKEK